MLEIEQAQELLCNTIDEIKNIEESFQMESMEQVPLLSSVGRVLATDVTALYDQPPYPRSPLDGYAVRGQDTMDASKEAPVCLQVIGKVYAGQVYTSVVEEGQAVRIMTGAPIPDGADTVIRQEDTDYNEEMVSIYRGSAPYQNYCYQGEDYKKGDVLIEKDTVITSGMISVLASVGLDQVSVYKLPRVGIISTGDEVIQPGSPLLPGKIYDSNMNYIAARLMELKVPPMIATHCADQAEAMAAMIKEHADSLDLIVTTGGVSVGEKDIMHDVLTLLDARKLFWRVNLKPGAPTLSFVYQNTLVICLSGNPYGAIANFELLVRKVLGICAKNPSLCPSTKKAVLTNGFSKGGCRRFIRGIYEDGKATIHQGNHASGVISSMIGSNCLIEITEAMNGAKAGDEVMVYLF